MNYSTLGAMSTVLGTMIAMAVSCAAAGTNAGPILVGTSAHRFMISDHSGGGTDGTGPRIRIVGTNGIVEREVASSGDTQDPSVLPNGNVLYCARGEVVEVDRAGAVVFKFKPAGAPRYLTTAQRLPNGATLVGVNPDNMLLEVSRTGAVVKTIALSAKGAGDNESLRIGRQLPNGNYLVAHNRQQVVIEYAPEGRELKVFKTPGGPYQPIRLENGNTLVSCGAGKTVVEFDVAGSNVWHLTDADLPNGMRLHWMAGMQRLANGNTVMACWFPRGEFTGIETPQAIEVTREKKVVWAFGYPTWIGSLSNIQILE